MWPQLKVVIHWSAHALLDFSLMASNDMNWDGVLCWGIKPTPWSGGSFWNISLVYKFVISCIYSLVCNGIRFIPSQTNVRLGFCDMLGTIVLLVWSSTLAWRCHLALLGRSQNSILLLLLWLKKRSEEVCNGNEFTLTRVMWGVESLFRREKGVLWWQWCSQHQERQYSQ